MKLSDYAKAIDPTFRGTWTHFKAGKNTGAYLPATHPFLIPSWLPGTKKQPLRPSLFQ
jgi:hypothetical protein